MIKVLIIEDELMAQKELIRLLKEQQIVSLEILTSIESIEEAVNYLSRNQMPDLIFLDIHLSDGLSFEIFRKTSVSVPVIFTTAYDQYALKAFELNSIDYLLKPISPELLEKALIKFQTYFSNSNSLNVLTSNQLHSINQILNNWPKNYKERFLGKTANSLQHIDINEVAYFYADDVLVFLITKDGKRYQIDFKLENLESILDPKQFFRINRSVIIQPKAILKIEKHLNGRYALLLNPKFESEVLISKARVNEFLKWLEG